jgi:hypothetical protein
MGAAGLHVPPRSRSATCNCDELPPPHSIISSARAKQTDTALLPVLHLNEKIPQRCIAYVGNFMPRYWNA